MDLNESPAHENLFSNASGILGIQTKSKAKWELFVAYTRQKMTKSKRRRWGKTPGISFLASEE